ncbi:MAG: YggT family protein [Chromatiaceae bacterium]
MSSYLANPVVFLVQTLFGLYIALVLLRFLLQWTRADFYNPISQLVVKLTSPILRPLRQVIPGYGGVDLASLVVAWLLQALELALLTLILGLDRNLAGALAWAIPALISLAINMLLFAILIRVILSWVNPDPYHPAAALLDRLTEPVLGPARRLIPPISGLDLSPMVVMIALVVLEMLLIPPLKLVTASPF